MRKEWLKCKVQKFSSRAYLLLIVAMGSNPCESQYDFYKKNFISDHEHCPFLISGYQERKLFHYFLHLKFWNYPSYNKKVKIYQLISYIDNFYWAFASLL